MNPTVIYTSLLFFADGFSLNQSLVFIKTRRRDDAALLAHEMTHVDQMKACGTFTFWFRYLTSKMYRRGYEVEAYKKQISLGANLMQCALHLADNYFLGITYDDALAQLKDVTV
jgi:hypothetical protein